MSAKNVDSHNRWRSKTIAFRVTPEENEQIDLFVKLTGTTKQDYITQRLLQHDIVVQGNPRVYKALRDQLSAVHKELQRIEKCGELTPEFIVALQFMNTILHALKEECDARE